MTAPARYVVLFEPPPPIASDHDLRRNADAYRDLAEQGGRVRFVGAPDVSFVTGLTTGANRIKVDGMAVPADS